MSNTAMMELPASAPANLLVVETSRGPSLAGTRITVYAIMDCLKDDQSHELIKEDFLISDEQLNAVLQYIAANREAVERDYDAIVRRSEGRRAYSEQVYRARSPFPPDMSLAEKDALLRQELARKQQLSQAQHENDHSA